MSWKKEKGSGQEVDSLLTGTGAGVETPLNLQSNPIPTSSNGCLPLTSITSTSLSGCWIQLKHGSQQLIQTIHENSVLIGLFIFFISFLIGMIFYYIVNDWDIYLSYYYTSTVLLGTLYLVPVDNNPYSQIFTLFYFLWGMVLMASALAVSAQTILDRVVKIASEERKRVIEQAKLVQERQRLELERRERHKKRRKQRQRQRRKERNLKSENEAQEMKGTNEAKTESVEVEEDVKPSIQMKSLAVKRPSNGSRTFSNTEEASPQEIHESGCWERWKSCFSMSKTPQQSGYQPIHESSIELPPHRLNHHHRRSSKTLSSMMPAGHPSHEAAYYQHQGSSGDIERYSSNMNTFAVPAYHHGHPETCSDSSIGEGEGDIEAEGEDSYWSYYCSLCSYYCNTLSIGEWIFYYLDQIMIAIGWEYHRSKYLALTLLLVWGSLGVLFGLYYEKWTFFHSLYFTASAITAAGVAPPVCDGDSLEDCNLGPIRSILIGTYLIIGVPLFGYCLTQFAEYLLEQVVRAKELKLMMNPISKSELIYVLKLKQGVIPDQPVDDFDETLTNVTNNNTANNANMTSSNSRMRGLSRQSTASLSTAGLHHSQHNQSQHQHQHQQQPQHQSSSGIVLEFSDFLVLELLRLRKITKADLEYIKSVYDVLITQPTPSAAMEKKESQQDLTGTGSGTESSTPITPLGRLPRSRRNSIILPGTSYGALEPILEEETGPDHEGSLKVQLPSPPFSLSRMRSQSIKGIQQAQSVKDVGKFSVDSEGGSGKSISEKKQDQIQTQTQTQIPSPYSLSSKMNSEDEDYMSEGVDLEAAEQELEEEAKTGLDETYDDSNPSVPSSAMEEQDLLALQYNRLLLPAMKQLQRQSQLLHKNRSSISITTLADVNETEHLLAIRREPSTSGSGHGNGLFRSNTRKNFSNLPFNETDEEEDDAMDSLSCEDDDDDDDRSSEGRVEDEDNDDVEVAEKKGLEEDDDVDVELGKQSEGISRNRSAMMQRRSGMEDVHV